MISQNAILSLETVFSQVSEKYLGVKSSKCCSQAWEPFNFPNRNCIFFSNGAHYIPTQASCLKPFSSLERKWGNRMQMYADFPNKIRCDVNFLIAIHSNYDCRNQFKKKKKSKLDSLLRLERNKLFLNYKTYRNIPCGFWSLSHVWKFWILVSLLMSPKGTMIWFLSGSCYLFKKRLKKIEERKK